MLGGMDLCCPQTHDDEAFHPPPARGRPLRAALQRKQQSVAATTHDHSGVMECLQVMYQSSCRCESPRERGTMETSTGHTAACSSCIANGQAGTTWVPPPFEPEFSCHREPGHDPLFSTSSFASLPRTDATGIVPTAQFRCNGNGDGNSHRDETFLCFDV